MYGCDGNYMEGLVKSFAHVHLGNLSYSEKRPHRHFLEPIDVFKCPKNCSEETVSPSRGLINYAIVARNRYVSIRYAILASKKGM